MSAPIVPGDVRLDAATSSHSPRSAVFSLTHTTPRFETVSNYGQRDMAVRGRPIPAITAWS
jgi:hypothetical protein